MTAGLLVTNSVDQRVSLWNYDSGESTLNLTSSFTHDVADVSSMEVLRNRLAITAGRIVQGIVSSVILFPSSFHDFIEKNNVKQVTSNPKPIIVESCFYGVPHLCWVHQDC